MKTKKYKFKFFKTIPLHLEEGILYISLEYNMVSHLCACGCGTRIDTPLASDEWNLLYDGETITLRPSIGNWDLSCHSHYYITNSIAEQIPFEFNHKPKVKRKNRRQKLKDFAKLTLKRIRFIF